MERSIERLEKLAENASEHVERTGNILVDGFQMLALFVIGATIVWSAVNTYVGMMKVGVASVDDILLLFIFLELGAMVGIYFKTNRLPVQFLLYVAITVMTRSLASSLTIKNLEDQRLMAITGSILILAAAVFVLRYASHRLPPFLSHVETEEEVVEAKPGASKQPRRPRKKSRKKLTEEHKGKRKTVQKRPEK